MITYQLIWQGDYQEAHAIRLKVFVDEQKFVNEIDDLDDQAWHIVMHEDGRAIGTARAFIHEDGLCKIGRVAVLKECRGRHLGEAMLLYFEEELKKRGAKAFQVGAQVRASGFYEKLGYVRHGEEYLDEYCPHIDMFKPPIAE